MVNFYLDIREDNSPEGVIHSHILRIEVGNSIFKIRLNDTEFKLLKKTINQN